MKVLDPVFQANLSKEVTTIAWCWLIVRQDNTKLGFTSFDLPLVIEGLTYEAQTGFDPSAVTSSEGVERNDSQSLKSIISSESISEIDLLGGKYNYAEIICFLVDVTDLPVSLTAMPPKHLHLYTGSMGQAKKSDRDFEIEIRGLDHKLGNNLGKTTSKFCSWEFGDSDCTADLTPYTFEQAITQVSNQYIFKIDGTIPDTVLDRGKITFLSGANAGINADIAYYGNGKDVTLYQPLPAPIEIGDRVRVVYGCQKTMLACAKYGNVINFGGEPDVPTANKSFNLS